MDNTESPMRIVVADDHALVRGGIGQLVKLLHPNSVLVECNTYEGILRALDGEEPVDLMLLDLMMPGMDLVHSVKHICSTWADVPVVVISMRDDTQTIREVLRAGAVGYIPKTSSPDVTMNAIRLVLSGGIYVPPDVLELGYASAEQKAAEFPGAEGDSTPGRKFGLTARQEDVIALISEGYSNKEIASELNLTPGTIKMHLSRIYKVLGVKSRTEAIAKHMKLGASTVPR